MDSNQRTNTERWCLAVLSGLLLTSLAHGQEAEATEPALQAQGQRTGRAGYEEVPQFGGPSSAGAQLEEDDRPKETVLRFDGIQRGLAPYFDWKARLQEDHGLSFGMDYTALVQGASNSPGEDSAAGGIFRLFGNWTLLGHGTSNTGSIVFKGESRHRLGTDVPPSALGFETGYVGLTAAPYNDEGWWLTNLYWQQRTNEGHLNFVAGFVDVTDYLDVYGLVNPWTAFTNLAFITGSATTPAPNQGLGAAVGAMLTDNIYLVAGLADANGDPGDPGEGFDTFFGDHEYFKHVELGWTPSYDRRYLDNAHVTFWHVDERDDAGVPDGWGVNVSFARFLDDTWMPFVRAGYSDDGGALLEKSVSVGIGRYMAYRRDLLGLGLNWGEPSSDFGSGLDDQYTAELFYRVQLSENFAVTPDLQAVLNPALNPDEDTLFVLGLRARLAL
jgi:porin